MVADQSRVAPGPQVRTASCCRALVAVLLLAITVAALAADNTTSPAVTHVLGTVLDASGKPAKGALVGVIESHQALLEMDRSGKTFDAKVGADGRFDLPLPSNLGTV